MDNATKAAFQTRQEPPQGVYSRVNFTTSEVIGETKKKGWVHPKATKIFVLLRLKKKMHSQRHFIPRWAPRSSMTNWTITRTNSHQEPLIAEGIKMDIVAVGSKQSRTTRVQNLAPENAFFEQVKEFIQMHFDSQPTNCHR